MKRVSWSEPQAKSWQVLDLTGVDRSALTKARRWAETQLVTLSKNHLVDTIMVIGELLENAYQHAGEPHQLRIHHEKTPCQVIVAVTDAGAGEPRLRSPTAAAAGA